MNARTSLLIDNEVDRITRELSANPDGDTSAVGAVVKRLMVRTNGRLAVNYVPYEIKAKALGAGAYRLSLKRGA